MCDETQRSYSSLRSPSFIHRKHGHIGYPIHQKGCYVRLYHRIRKMTPFPLMQGPLSHHRKASRREPLSTLQGFYREHGFAFSVYTATTPRIRLRGLARIGMAGLTFSFLRPHSHFRKMSSRENTQHLCRRHRGLTN